MTAERPRNPKTNEAIRAGIRAWWSSPSQVATRAREAASWARFYKDCEEFPSEMQESLSLEGAAAYAHIYRRAVTVARVVAAARGWGEVGLDCGEGLVARMEQWGVGDWRIVVSGPLDAV